METKKAIIKREPTKVSLLFEVGEENLEIVLTEDNPNDIKAVFNNLLKKLKKGCFCFELDDETADLYNDICTEYIKQLNSELKSVYDELHDYDLLEEIES